MTPISLAEIDTPFLAVDLDILEANIAKMKAAIIDRGVNWRPHVKAIKTPVLAHKLLAAGAIGVTCAKLSEAEVMVQGGIREILIANQVVPPRKRTRLALLNRRARVICAVDQPENARALGAAALEAGTTIPVVIEVNIGIDRSGVEPGPAALDLARIVAATPGVRFLGFMGWEGHATVIADPAEKEAEVRRSVARIAGCAEACRQAGIPVEIVSCGGTGTYWLTPQMPGVTEVQAGGGIFCDRRYRLEYGVAHDYALTVWTTVISRPTPTRLVCDAGWKAMAKYPIDPEPIGLSGVAALSLSAEHAAITFTAPTETPRVGDSLRFVVGYSDSTVMLHNRIHALRGGRPEAVWPLLARGMLD